MDTIKSIAQKAGVSISTVSRVINQNRPVSPELNDKVMEVISQSNYIPNTAARALSANKTNAIGIMVNNLHDPFFHDLLLGFESGARDTDFKVVFCSTMGQDFKERHKYFRYLSSGVVDGIILYGTYILDEELIVELNEAGFPLFLIENTISRIKTHSFLINNQKGIEDAVNYLYKKGHRRIAYIAGKQDKQVNAERLKGFKTAVSSLTLYIPDNYIQFIQEGPADGATIMNNLMSLSKDEWPTVVLCYDDLVAVHAIEMALSSGYSVPKDISVMGFDNQLILPMGYKGPQITSIQQPLYNIAYDSVVMLSQYLTNEDKGYINKVYDTEIVEKNSVATLSQ